MSIVPVIRITLPPACTDGLYPLDDIDVSPSISSKLITVTAFIQGFMLGFNYASFCYFPLCTFYLFRDTGDAMTPLFHYDILTSILTFITFYFLNPVRPVVVHYYSVLLIIFSIVISLVSFFVEYPYLVSFPAIAMCTIIVNLAEFSVMGIYSFGVKNNIAVVYAGKCVGTFVSTLIVSMLTLTTILKLISGVVVAFVCPILLVILNLLNMVLWKCILSTKDYKSFLCSQKLRDVVETRCNMSVGFKGCHHIKRAMILYFLMWCAVSLSFQPYVYEPLPHFYKFFPAVLLKSVGDFTGSIFVALDNEISQPITYVFIGTRLSWVCVPALLSFIVSFCTGNQKIVGIIAFIVLTLISHSMSYATAVCLKNNIDDASKALNVKSTVSISMLGILIMKLISSISTLLYRIALILMIREPE